MGTRAAGGRTAGRSLDRRRLPSRGRLRRRTRRPLAPRPAPPRGPDRMDGELPRRAGAQLMDADRLAAEAAVRYLGALAERRVAPTSDAVARLAELGGPLPDGPCDPAEVVGLL